jgi:hypothetical protein
MGPTAGWDPLPPLDLVKVDPVCRFLKRGFQGGQGGYEKTEMIVNDRSTT